MRETFKSLSYVFFLFLLVACSSSNKNKIVNLTLNKRISLPLPNELLDRKLNNFPHIVKFIENNSQLIVYFYNINYLFFYELKTGKIINKIHLPKNFNFNNVEYYNRDSIFLFFSGNNKLYYDTSIVLINYEGNIRKSYGLIHKCILSSFTCNLQNLNKQSWKNYLFPYFNHNNITYKNKFYFSLNCIDEKIKENKHIPIYGYYDLLSRKTVIDTEITYPIKKPLDVFNYPCDFMIIQINIVPEKKELLLSFAFSPSIYRIDLESNKKEWLLLDSKFSDTSWIYKKGGIGNNYGYSGVFYIKSLKKYFRIKKFMVGEQWLKSIVTYDEKFSYLGEHLIEINLDIINDKIYYADIENDSLIIKLYKPYEIAFDKIKLDSIKKSLPKPTINDNKSNFCNIAINDTTSFKNILDYLKNKYLTLDSSCPVLILHENGCSPCNEYFINFLSKNNNLLNKKTKALRFIYITDKTTEVEKYFSKKKITKFILDRPANYNLYHPFKFFNPRLILVRNQKIISDTIYMPDQCEKLLERLLDFYGVVQQ